MGSDPVCARAAKAHACTRAERAENTTRRSKTHSLAQPALFPLPSMLDTPPAFLEEAAGPRYVVEVDVDAVPLPAGHTPDLPPGARSITLPGPGGARFACTIPPPPPPD